MVTLHPRDDALDGVRRVLAHLTVSIDANLPGTIDDLEPDSLHELRVAVRRTRSVLAQARGVLPSEVRSLHRETFSRLGEITGAARDLDVHLLGWDDLVAPFGDAERGYLEPARALLATRRRAAHDALAAELRSPQLTESLDAWRRWLADPDVTADEPRPLGPFVAARIRKVHSSVLAAGAAITPASPPERLHDLRKDAKKLRYLLECFAGLFPPKAHRKVVRRLRDLQDNLGLHQDAEVHVAELRDLARELHRSEVATEVLLAIGRLTDRLERRRQHARNDFAARFCDYATKEGRGALDDLLRPLTEPPARARRRQGPGSTSSAGSASRPAAAASAVARAAARSRTAPR
jgi:CHAD domain-containing protein